MTVTKAGREILLRLLDAERHGEAQLPAGRFHTQARQALQRRDLVVTSTAGPFTRLTTTGRGCALRLQKRLDL